MTAGSGPAVEGGSPTTRRRACWVYECVLIAMESFFALLQRNPRLSLLQTRDELKIEIVTWIEGIYH